MKYNNFNQMFTHLSVHSCHKLAPRTIILSQNRLEAEIRKHTGKTCEWPGKMNVMSFQHAHFVFKTFNGFIYVLLQYCAI